MTLNFDQRNMPCEIIAAGCYGIENSAGKFLTALLGSCVGVALYDKEAGVGGLIHLLLPEPTGANTEWQPESYARTGLPIFINALLTAGASQKNLQACVAGGSLLAPISPLDLNLNIGGHTAQVVHEILHRQNIPILISETGGYFGTKFILNTHTWEVTLEPSIPQHPRPLIIPAAPSLADIEQAILTTEPIPQIALKIIEIIRNRNYQASDLLKEIERDQIITARVLHLSNSSLFGVREKIDSIQRAVILLGENHLLDIVTSAAVSGYFTQDGGGYSLMRGGLYLHSIGVANVAKIIAQFTGKTPADTAYTSGLLHDIGKVVLDCFIRDISPLFYARAQDKIQDITSLENELFGIDHQAAGEMLASNWGLPDTIKEVISLHHCPEKASICPELVRIVLLADILTSAFCAGIELEQINSQSLSDLLEDLGISDSQLSVIIDKVPWRKLHVL